MELLPAIAIELKKCGVEWPEGAAQVVQVNRWAVVFRDKDGSDIEPSTDQNGDMQYWNDWEVVKVALPYMGDWDDESDPVTKEEYDAFVANEHWYEEIQAKQVIATARIAELNKQLAAIVNEMQDIAESHYVDFKLNLGSIGVLDPNSDWASSRC